MSVKRAQKFLDLRDFVIFRSLPVITQTAKSVFVRKNAKHPTQCSREMPHQNSFDDANRYIYYIYARKPLYIVVGDEAASERNLIRRHKNGSKGKNPC